MMKEKENTPKRATAQLAAEYITDPATCFFKATWGNEGEHAGLVTPYGLVVKPLDLFI